MTDSRTVLIDKQEDRDMQLRDHRILAVFLIDKMGRSMSFFYRRMFILGSLEPDRKPFTYLHGITKGEKFHGHNYENILPVMRKLFESPQSKNKLGIRDYYRLGKLTHYVADAFTYPHNRIFQGSLLQHCRYEQELHCEFVSALRRQGTDSGDLQRIRRFQDIENLHEEYLRHAGGCEADCGYILKVSGMLLKGELQRSPKASFVQKERLAG